MDLQIKVAQAVHVLNHDTQSCNRVAANQWLVQFQQTDTAWEVATSILTSDRPLSLSPDFELEFFAAQILKRKVPSPASSSYSSLFGCLLDSRSFLDTAFVRVPECFCVFLLPLMRIIKASSCIC